MSRMFDSVSGKANLGGRFDAGTGGPETVIINPATEQRIGSWTETNPANMDAAISAAGAAQAAWWRKQSGLERAQKLHDVAAATRERQSLLAEALTREMGKP